MISSSAFFMVFNTAILTAFFGESFDFVRVFIGLRRLGFFWPQAHKSSVTSFSVWPNVIR